MHDSWGLRTISPEALRHMMQTGQVTVIDLNSRHSWITARVPGAVNLKPATFSDTDLPQEAESSLVFYCSNPLCRKAPNPARRAMKMGYRSVRVMSAGISGWLAARLPTESGEH